MNRIYVKLSFIRSNTLSIPFNTVLNEFTVKIWHPCYQPKENLSLRGNELKWKINYACKIIFSLPL